MITEVLRKMPPSVRRAARRLRRTKPGATTAAKPAKRPTLDEIGLRTGTDKSSAIHDYLSAYEKVFQHLRDRPIQFVEIGVHKGASLRMWEEYFPRARLFGIDISEDCLQYSTERATVLLGDQAKPQVLTKLARKLRPTIVIDDGSHVWRHQIETLQTLLPVVRAGGFFVVEDIHTSFGDDYAKTYGRDRSTETAFDYVQRIARAVTAGNRAADIGDDFIAYCRETVESVQFIRNSAIFQKRSFPQGKYRVRSVAEVVDDPQIQDVGGSYARIPAELVGADASVKAAFDRLYGDGTVEVPEAASAELKRARVVNSGVVTVGSSIIDETLNCARNLQHGSGLYQVIRGSIWVDERSSVAQHHVPAVEGRRHVLLKQTWDANYGHWIVDTLPKVGLLREFEDLSRCLFVLNEQPSPAMRLVVQDSLGLFGVSPDQLLFLDKDSYEFERLTVLGTLSRHPVNKSHFAIEVLEGLADKVGGDDGPKRLYVTRPASARRRLADEDAVIEMLSARGYTVVEPGGLPVTEQMRMFRNANQVVGVMGAALTNLAFSPRGVSVLSLATPAMKHDFFYDIVCLKGGRYRGLQGEAMDAGSGPTLATHFSVDLEQLSRSLDWLESDEPGPVDT